MAFLLHFLSPSSCSMGQIPTLVAPAATTAHILGSGGELRSKLKRKKAEIQGKSHFYLQPSCQGIMLLPSFPRNASSTPWIYQESDKQRPSPLLGFDLCEFQSTFECHPITRQAGNIIIKPRARRGAAPQAGLSPAWTGSSLASVLGPCRGLRRETHFKNILSPVMKAKNLISGLLNSPSQMKAASFCGAK